jgi:hypothetical protein
MYTLSSTLRSILSRVKQHTIFIFVFRDDWPRKAIELNLSRDSDRQYLDALIDLVNNPDEPGWGTCQFKNRAAYNKGRRMVGQHKKLWRSMERDSSGDRVGVRIGRFQGLVEPLGYQKTPLSEADQKRVRQEYQQGASIKKLIDDWDVSETYIRGILKGDKPPVSPQKKPINIDLSAPEPPPGSRVTKVKGGLANVE